MNEAPTHARFELAVSVKNLEKRFGEFRAVKGVSFGVEKGKIFGFLGPNGAGKSTTIKMLCGILTPTAGEGQVMGFDVRTEPESIKAHIGYMSQRFSLYEDLTVGENLSFYGGLYRVSPLHLEARKNWALEMAGLTQRIDARVSTLPTGWRQRLALGSAVLHEPPILFLDEPTSGVDPISRRRFWDLIYTLSDSGTTVFVTTHYMDEAEYCDELVLIYRGAIIAQGAPATLKLETMRDKAFAVQCDRPHEAIDALSDLEGVHQAALFGNGLHVLTEDLEPLSERIRSRLTERGFTVRLVEQIVPSLEDVFVSLIERYDREEAANEGDER